MLVTEGGQGVGEEGERHGGDEAHQAFTLWVLQLATEAGPLQEGDHLSQGVLLRAGDTSLESIKLICSPEGSTQLCGPACSCTRDTPRRGDTGSCWRASRGPAARTGPGSERVM